MREKKSIIELTRTTREAYRRMRKLPLVLVCDNVRSMHNVGSLFRTSDAFLIEEIILCGITACPPQPEISKTALGAEESVRWHYAVDALSIIKSMKNEGWKLIVLEQAHDSLPIEEFKAEKGERYLLVVGNEVDGVSQPIVDMADIILEIAQHGVKHSLNVSVSGGIALWAVSSAIERIERGE